MKDLEILVVIMAAVAGYCVGPIIPALIINYVEQRQFDVSDLHKPALGLAPWSPAEFSAAFGSKREGQP